MNESFHYSTLHSLKYFILNFHRSLRSGSEAISVTVKSTSRTWITCKFIVQPWVFFTLYFLSLSFLFLFCIAGFCISISSVCLWFIGVSLTGGFERKVFFLIVHFCSSIMSATWSWQNINGIHIWLVLPTSSSICLFTLLQRNLNLTCKMFAFFKETFSVSTVIPLVVAGAPLNLIIQYLCNHLGLLCLLSFFIKKHAKTCKVIFCVGFKLFFLSLSSRFCIVGTKTPNFYYWSYAMQILAAHYISFNIG